MLPEGTERRPCWTGPGGAGQGRERRERAASACVGRSCGRDACRIWQRGHLLNQSSHKPTSSHLIVNMIKAGVGALGRGRGWTEQGGHTRILRPQPEACRGSRLSTGPCGAGGGKEASRYLGPQVGLDSHILTQVPSFLQAFAVWVKCLLGARDIPLPPSPVGHHPRARSLCPLPGNRMVCCLGNPVLPGHMGAPTRCHDTSHPPVTTRPVCEVGGKWREGRALGRGGKLRLRGHIKAGPWPHLKGTLAPGTSARALHRRLGKAAPVFLHQSGPFLSTPDAPVVCLHRGCWDHSSPRPAGHAGYGGWGQGESR